jgi:hypothetical protein
MAGRKATLAHDLLSTGRQFEVALSPGSLDQRRNVFFSKVVPLAGYLALGAFFVVLACGLLSAVPAPTIRFADVAAQRGIRAQMRCGGPRKQWIPEANGSGVAWLDYDRDGRMDLLIVNGSTISDLREIIAGRIPAARPGSVYLYHNRADGTFEDVTARAGLRDPYWGTGVAVGDFNNDGFPDFLITNIGLDLLFRNNGDGTFTEIGSEAGLSRRVDWHTGAAFGDYDKDGQPDIYIAGYVDLNELKLDEPGLSCKYRSLSVFCGPKGLRGATDLLYHNEGSNRFKDVTRQAGVEDKKLYHGFTVVFDDFNGDGNLDILVANDSDPNYLYLNQGNGTFREAGLESGVAVNGDGQSQSNMGIAVGDFDNNGLIDVLTTTFSEDYFPLFSQESPGTFEDVSAKTGLGTITLPWVGWACGFADLDNDGRKDLWIANGHVYPNADQLSTTTWLQPVAIFANAGGAFVHLPGASSTKLPESWRAGAAGDFNNDGKVDLVVLPIAGEPLLLENRTDSHSHWIGLTLEAKGSRDATGARVRISHCGASQFEIVRNGGSYISHDDPRIHFGLGSCNKVDKLEVAWPDGTKQVLKDLETDRYLTITQH